MINIDEIPHNPRTASEIFRDYVERGFTADDAFIIAARAIAVFPHRHHELAELNEDYIRRRDIDER